MCRLPPLRDVIKQRLLNAGMDARLWPSQIGFQRERWTVDAMYVARRHTELGRARRRGQLNMLSLDWAGAFDSVHIERLIQGLRRFGITGQALEAISELMHTRKFYVEESGHKSEQRAQRSGIT